MDKDKGDNLECCTNADNLIEIDGFITCNKCGYCKQDYVYDNCSKLFLEESKKDIEIEDMCENGSVQGSTKLNVYKLFEKWHLEHPYLNRIGLKATAMYVSCKIDNCPRSMKEISSMTGVSVKKIGKYENILNQRYIPILPEMYLDRFCAKLNFQYDFVKQCKLQISKLNSNFRLNPITCSAGIIYLTYVKKFYHDKKFLKKLQKVTGVSYSSSKKIINLTELL